MEIIKETNISARDYYNVEAVSQSSLKEIAKGPKNYLRSLTFSESTDYLKLGSAVDVLLTDADDFENQFKVMDISMPSDTIRNIVESIYQNAEDVGYFLDESVYEPYILAAAESFNYGSKWKPATVIKKVVEDGSRYFIFLRETKDKELLSTEEYQRAENCVTHLITDFYTKDYFTTSPHVEHLYQLPIAWKYVYTDLEHVLCKSLLDIVRIDHKAKTIKGIDIKTIGMPIAAFLYNFLKFRYDFQAAFYTLALNYYKTVNKNLEGYKLLPFEFVVVESSGNTAPRRFVCPSSITDKVMGKGFEYKGKNYMGVEQAFSDYRWYKERGWTDVYPRSYIENKGYEILDLDIK